MRGEVFDAPPLRNVAVHERRCLRGFSADGAERPPPWRRDASGTFTRRQRRHRDGRVADVRSNGFENSQQECMCAEVSRRVLPRFRQGDELIQDWLQPFDLSFSKAEYLHGVGVELGGEVAGCVAVGDQAGFSLVSVLPLFAAAFPSDRTFKGGESLGTAAYGRGHARQRRGIAVRRGYRRLPPCACR